MPMNNLATPNTAQSKLETKSATTNLKIFKTKKPQFHPLTIN